MKSFAKIILTAATAATMLSAPAYAIDYYDIQISRPEDLSMSCSEISQEVRLMEEIIRRSKETQE
ncbi:MAG: hypothetical protein KDD04_07955, partial [Sinomicrobium sp.]|nr:hypothetical protein [Sinomicrobium sp.]